MTMQVQTSLFYMLSFKLENFIMATAGLQENIFIIIG